MKYRLPRMKSAEIRMTPMIDVIFLLLVFFVSTANFNPLEKMLPMDTTLPGSSVADVVLPDPIDLDAAVITITFNSKPHWQIEGNQCATLEEVQNVLKTLWEVNPDIPLIIESSDNVPMETVIDAYDVCRGTGFTRIQFSAQ